jgi:hypothetical protein
MGHSIKDCTGLTLADRVRGGPSTTEKEDYNDPDEQNDPPNASQSIEANLTRASQASNVDHFDGSIINVGNVDTAASLIDLSDNVTVDPMVVDSENVTASVSNTVVGSVIVDRGNATASGSNTVVGSTIVDSDNATALSSNTVVGSMLTLNEIVKQMQTSGTSSVGPGVTGLTGDGPPPDVPALAEVNACVVSDVASVDAAETSLPCAGGALPCEALATSKAQVVNVGTSEGNEKLQLLSQQPVTLSKLYSASNFRLLVDLSKWICSSKRPLQLMPKNLHRTSQAQAIP